MSLNIGLISLGCAKNLVDSEIMLGYLKQAEFRIVSSPEEADILLVNTCGFIGPAKEESIENILEMAEYKKKGKCRGLIVTGCLSARYKDELHKEIPEIDGMLGTGEMDQVPAIIDRILAGEYIENVSKDAFSYDRPDLPRLLTTGGHIAYLKIAEGCSHKCAFCVIPKIRGPYRSRNPEAILDEAHRLAESGVKELIVIAQDTTQYGKDLGDVSLNDLLKKLVEVDIPWIRVLYTYPDLISEELLELIANNKKIVNYMDLPMQHASESVLRKMGRPSNYQRLLSLVKSIRGTIPNVTIRSSFIVGFPGETDKDFKQLLDFLKEAKLNNTGIFKYSAEEDTVAYEMSGHVDEEIKTKRYNLAMETQREISYQLNQKLVGKELEVLIDGRSAETDSLLTGRYQGQALDVDGAIYIGNKLANKGDLVKVKIIKAYPYDLVGEIV